MTKLPRPTADSPQKGDSAASIPAVAYGAKSSPDEKESVADQQRQVVDAIEREGGRFLYADPFGEADVSGYRKSRGPELEAAISAAKAAAAEHGESELWVFHTSRVARGSGRKAEARSYIKLWADLQAEGVQLRAVTDDEFATNPVLVGIASQQNHKYSVDLAAHVTRGLRQTFEQGKRLGGPVPDGYGLTVMRDDRDRVVERRYWLDQERADVIRLAFDLYEGGMGDPSVAKEMNRRGLRTKAEGRWTRRRVQDTLTNQFYAGRVVRRRGKPDEEVRPGLHPALIEPERFDRLLSMRGTRDRAAGSERSPMGRPPTNHALAKLTVCAYCGGALTGRTSTYVRKDGSRHREYRCIASMDGSGACRATWGYDAELIDRAVVANLDRYLGDFEAWREQIEDGHRTERERLAGEVERAREGLAEVRTLTGRIEAAYERHVAAGEDEEAATVLRILTRRLADEQRAERRLRAAEDAEVSVPDEAPADAMLDFYNALGAAVRGRIEGADTLAKVNDALRDLFECFIVGEAPGGRFAVQPVLLESTPLAVTLGEDGSTDSNGATLWHIMKGYATVENCEEWGGIVVGGDERIVPPLRRIEAPSPKVTERHAYRCRKRKRAAFAASQAYAVGGPRSSSVA